METNTCLFRFHGLATTYSFFLHGILGSKLLSPPLLRMDEPTNSWKVLQHLEAHLQKLLNPIPPRRSNTVKSYKKEKKSNHTKRPFHPAKKKRTFLIRLHQPLQILLHFVQPPPAHVRGESAKELLQHKEVTMDPKLQKRHHIDSQKGSQQLYLFPGNLSGFITRMFLSYIYFTWRQNQD